MILVYFNIEFKASFFFSLSSFTLIINLFSFSSPSVFRVVSSEYLRRLLIFFLAILILAVIHPGWNSI